MKFLKDWTLVWAMLIGSLTYQWIGCLSFLIPYLIFSMLLLTFCKLSPRDLHFHKAQLWLVLIELLGCIPVYFLVRLYNPLVAQGALICVLAPTAAAAAVITGMLGGSISFIATYLFICNIGVAALAPLLFTMLGTHSEMTFMQSFLHICWQVATILVLPLAIAWFLQYFMPKVHDKLASIHKASFYLWATSLTVLTGTTVKFVVDQPNPDVASEIGLAVVALIICILQFLIGRRIGRHYNDPVSSGQGLGQKNTAMAIWMAQVYLNPVSSIAPASYVLWQNIINSYQLWRKNRKDRMAQS
jgi:BASS family bile acid:Na+ symporter